MEDMKKVKSLEESELFIEVAIEKIKNEAKGQKVGFLGMLLCILSVGFI